MQISAVSHAALAAAVSRTSGVTNFTSVTTAINAFKADPTLKGITISASGASVGANFSELAKMGKSLTSISLTGSAAITLTATQKADVNTKAALAVISGTYNVKVTGVTADSIKSTLSDTHVNHLEIADTAANVSAAFVGKTPDVIANATKIDKIVLSDPANAVAMTGAQYTANQTLLGKIEGKTGATTSSASNVKFSLTSVTQGNLVAALNASKVVSATVLDTAANLTALTADQINNSKVTTLTQSDTATVALSAAKYKAINDKGNLDKFAPGTKVVVNDVKAADADSVLTALSDAGLDGTVTIKDNVANVLANAATNNVKGTKIKTTIEDSVFNVHANWAAIKAQNLEEITKIKLTDSGSVVGKLEVAFSDLADQKALFEKMYAGAGAGTKATGIVSVTGVAAADVLATAKLASVGGINVSDTVTNGIAAQGMLKAQSTGSGKVKDIQLSGSASDIQANFDKLDAFGKTLSAVTASAAGHITVSYDKYVKQSGLIDKIDVATNAADFKVTDVTADKAKLVLNTKNDDGTFTRNTDIASITVKDSGAKITSNWGDLKTAFAAGDLTDATLTDNGVIKLASAATYTDTDSQGLLDKIRTTNAALPAKDVKNYTIAVSGVAVADLAGVQSASVANWAKVAKVSVSDTADNISAALATDIEGLGSKLDKILQTDAPSGRHDIQVSFADLQRSPIAAELDKIYGNTSVGDTSVLGYHMNTVAGDYKLKVTDVTADKAAALVTNDRFSTKVNKLTVNDTAANITANLAALNNIAATKMDAITNSDSGLIEVGATDFKANTYAVLLAKADVQDLRVLNAKASDATGIAARDHVTELTVTDASSSIGAKLTDLNTLVDATKLTKITLNDANVAISLSDTQYDNGGASALGVLNVDADHLNGNYKLTISGTAVADAVVAGKMVNADDHVQSYSVTDTGTNIVAGLTDLEANATKLTVINQSDTTQLEIFGADYHDSIGTLNKINNGSGGYDAKVTDLQADDTVAAQADTNVTEFTVKGDAAHLGANWASLQASAAETTPKMTGITLDGSDAIDISYDQWNTGTALKAAMATGFTWNVSGVDTAHVADVFADSQLDHMTVTGSASDIVAKLGDGNTAGDLDAAVAKITSVTVTDNAVLSLSGTQYADNKASGAILDLTANANGGHYHATVSGLLGANVADATTDQNVDSFDVADTGTNLSGTNFTDLVAANTAGKLTSVVLDANDATVTVAMADMVANHADYADTLSKFDTTNPVGLSLT